MNKSELNIGGRKYDPETGEFLGIDNSAQPIAAAAQTTQALHQKPSANTLNRQFVNKPKLSLAANATPQQANSKPRIILSKHRSSDIIHHVKTSPIISKFNPGDFNPHNRPVVISEVRNPDVIVTPEQQAVYQRALDRARQAKMIDRYRARQIELARRQQYQKLFKQPSSKTTPQVANSQTQTRDTNQRAKNAAINQAIAQALNTSAKAKLTFWSITKPSKSLVLSGLAVLLIILGIAYFNWPKLSLALANYQAGINTSLPAYRPFGYRFQSASSAKSGQLSIILANSNGQLISIHQEKTSWDSDALLQNFVKKQVDDNYTTYREQGLTIYSYGGTQLAWVNGGILYHMIADTSVSAEQLRRTATSL